MKLERARIGTTIDLVVRDKDGKIKSHKRIHAPANGAKTEEQIIKEVKA